jgi:type IV secretory pathway VirJ component
MKTSWLCTALAIAATAFSAHADETLSHGRFSTVTLYRPTGEVKSVVLFMSGDGGWNQGVVDMAQALANDGAMVAGIDVPKLLANLDKDGEACVSPDGDLENLSHYLQSYAKLPTYHTPVLAGYSSGATLAYAMLAQAPANTFAGALSLGFCPDLLLHKPLCRGAGLTFNRRKQDGGIDVLPSAKLGNPWIVLNGAEDQVCELGAAKEFVAQTPNASFVELPKVGHGYSVPRNWMPQFLTAFHSLEAQTHAALPPPPASLADLPLVEVPAAAGHGDLFAVLLSGDGGWAGLDKDVAAALAAQGISVVGLDSLRYFWTARTPDSLAADLDRVLRYYTATWHKSHAVLIGYSQGADVLPFAVNRLPAASRSFVDRTVMMGLGENASFEFHFTNWLGTDSGLPILPEVARLEAGKTLCFYGKDEGDSLCPKVPAGHVQAVQLPGGHHFDGAYDSLARRITSGLKLS